MGSKVDELEQIRIILDRFDRVAELNESFFAKKSREKHSFCPCSSHPYVSQNWVVWVKIPSHERLG
jgi:hypothetical protein